MWLLCGYVSPSVSTLNLRRIGFNSEKKKNFEFQFFCKFLIFTIKLTAVHTAVSVRELFNILPSQVTVAADGANCNPEQALSFNGVELPIDWDTASVTNGSELTPTHNPIITSDNNSISTQQQEEAGSKDTEIQLVDAEDSGLVKVVLDPKPKQESDRRLTAVQRSLDLIADICNNRHLSCLWAVLLLKGKLNDVRDYLLNSITTDPSGSTETEELLDEIDLRVITLSSRIKEIKGNQNPNLDPMGFDIINWIRHWLPRGGRKNSNKDKDNKESSNTAKEETKTTQKRNHQSLGNDTGAHQSIKYRRVDNTFPKFMPNDADTSSKMATATVQRKEQESNNSNRNASQSQKRLSIFNTPPTRQVNVRGTLLPTTTIDLSDSEDQQHNESNLYQTFADRLGTSGQPTTRPAQELGRSSSTRRHNLLYSEAVRFGTNGFNSQRPSSSLSSTEARLNGHSSNHFDSSVMKDTILNLEDQRNEHNQYINLINNLTLHERDYARRTAALSDKVKAPPLPLLRPLTLKGPEWMHGYFKNKSDIITNEHCEFAKLINCNWKSQQQSNQALQSASCKKKLSSDTINLYIKPGPNNIPNSSTTAITTSTAKKAEKPSGIETINEHIGKETNKSQLMPPPPKEPSMSRTKALQMRNNKSIYFDDNFTNIFSEKCERSQSEVNHTKTLVLQEAEKTTEERRAFEQGLRESLAKRRYVGQTLFVLDKYQLDEDSEPEFIPWNEAHQQRYNELVYGKPDQVLISKFSLSITRNDIRTLSGSSWLNDEVINFYMNLLTDRSQRSEGKLPSVYAMNTFFIPRLLQGGYGNVKRWTRKVDIFSKDIIPVPVHVSNVHWCMAIIHMKNKSIRYYDSMGKPNSEVLNALENYLLEESLDKRKKPFDTSDFTIENVQNVPHQTNGSDCGVFSCMFAEYITRNKPLTFSQEHMEYFRKKMAIEICDGELWM